MSVFLALRYSSRLAALPLLQIPVIDAATMAEWRALSFPELSAAVMGHYIPADEISPAALGRLVDCSYATFSTPEITPLIKVRVSVCVCVCPYLCDICAS